MSEKLLDAALVRGAVVVTPNKRLAREIADAYDAARLAERRTAWPSARTLPWNAFVGELVQRAQDARLALPAQRLDATQSLHLWRRIVAADREHSPLVDVDEVAALAAEAWAHVHSYGSGAESWRGFSGAGPDVDAFARWAEAYAKELRRLDAVDAARAPDVVAALAGELPGVRDLEILLAGFVELSPQQRRLIDALQSAGARVIRIAAEPASIDGSAARLAECGTPREELDRALDWARSRALADPDARIGIVVLDLAQRREAVRAACEERLCAPLQWPGNEQAIRPYELSLGTPLADVPLVASALALIALTHRLLDRARAAALVRSPYLPDAAREWMRRAALERSWLERGVRELGWASLVDEVARVDGHLAERWRWATGELRHEARLAPRAWVERWRNWLADVGWCDGRTLTSDEYQADGAWNELLGAFARLAGVAPIIPAREAIGTLERLAREQLFQPATRGARIRVLGLLEASGLAFDALWVAGMAADAWPRAPEPSPLLPIAWQRERNVPRASPDGELAFAREVTARLAHAAPEVVFSFAASADDHERSASPLVAALPRAGVERVPPPTARRLFEARPVLDAVADASAPPIEAGTKLPGGTSLVEMQSECGFRALAMHRLRAHPWPGDVPGLTPLERGQLVHATLHRFWARVRGHDTLAAMDDTALADAVDAAFDEARDTLPPARWAMLPPAIAASEAGCVARLACEWLANVERGRPPFTVAHAEQRATVALAGHTMDIRIDRVDTLQDGGSAVIDYKSGFAKSPAGWFDERPSGLQLALYARAHAQAFPDAAVRALAYGQLRPGDVRAIGLHADAAVWPGLTLPEGVRQAGLVDWADADRRLQQALERIAGEFSAGHAGVAPRDPGVCKNCGLHALCRIADTADADVGVIAEGDDV